MTEQEWLTCSDPTPMLVFLRWTPILCVRRVLGNRFDAAEGLISVDCHTASSNSVATG
jgi:hypothetical protein